MSRSRLRQQLPAQPVPHPPVRLRGPAAERRLGRPVQCVPPQIHLPGRLRPAAGVQAGPASGGHQVLYPGVQRNGVWILLRGGTLHLPAVSGRSGRLSGAVSGPWRAETVQDSKGVR
uniref:(northern house mosquito) hypothetical protein n=1 Tax=Culex pipiens TaxID=7175 RepID=A0A8D8CQ93_CULPI